MKNLFHLQTPNTHHTPRFFLWLENVVIPNYNVWKLLTFQKNKRASKRPVFILLSIVVTLGYNQFYT